MENALKVSDIVDYEREEQFLEACVHLYKFTTVHVRNSWYIVYYVL